MSWKDDDARILSRTIEGTEQGPPTRQQLRHTDRIAYKRREQAARAKLRDMRRSLRR